MNWRKRVSSIVLAVVFLVLLPSSTLAANPSTGSYIVKPSDAQNCSSVPYYTNIRYQLTWSKGGYTYSSVVDFHYIPASTCTIVIADECISNTLRNPSYSDPLWTGGAYAGTSFPESQFLVLNGGYSYGTINKSYLVNNPG